eukprot:131850-Chlamydomonas_euryale.AAC.1
MTFTCCDRDFNSSVVHGGTVTGDDHSSRLIASTCDGLLRQSRVEGSGPNLGQHLSTGNQSWDRNQPCYTPISSPEAKPAVNHPHPFKELKGNHAGLNPGWLPSAVVVHDAASSGLFSNLRENPGTPHCME